MKLILFLLFAPLTVFAQSPTPTPVIVTADRVGVNTTDPQAPLELKVRYPIDTTASETLIQFKTPTGHDPFQFYQRSTVFGNNRTDSVGIGFGPAGDPQGAPSLGLIFEDEFGSAPEPVNYELHYQMCATEGGCSRPMTWTFDRKTGKATAVYSAAFHIYGGGWLAGDKPSLHITPAETLSQGPFRLQSDAVKFETLANGGAQHKQVQIVPYPSDSGLSQLRFGDANGIGLANIGGVLQIERVGLPATVNLASVRVNNTKVLGQQCAAIPNPSESTASNTQAIISILNCLRSHGLVAN